MHTNIPSGKQVLTTLLKADFITQWRNRRSVVLVLLVPVIILISWKGLIKNFGGAFVIANCITIGLTAIGLMGYSNSIARDRDKGIFQRLRVAPVPSWSIMVSRLLVQLAMILLLTTAIYIAGHYFDNITLTPVSYLLGYFVSIVGGALYLGLGQAIVGRINNAETVNSTCRLVYFIFIMVGMFGDLGMLGNTIDQLVKWSPYGAVKHIIADAIEPGNWSMVTNTYLMVTIGYAIIFSYLGIKWFKWNSNK
ncbi:MAG: ABC transporter permease [Bacteroidetes bacterium]|nr:ABC transporter permease [Bacteroidota bacterium]MBS1757199.1 ABC transporter permease [Bacteroidota bacterium]